MALNLLYFFAEKSERKVPDWTALTHSVALVKISELQNSQLKTNPCLCKAAQSAWGCYKEARNHDSRPTVLTKNRQHHRENQSFESF